MSAQQQFDIIAIGQLLRRYLLLNVENFRLSLTERLTILMATAVFFLIALIFGSIGLVFITAGIGHLLKGSIGIEWIYMITGSIYFTAIVMIWLLRKKLLINPFCKFLSRLIVEPPHRNFE